MVRLFTLMNALQTFLVLQMVLIGVGTSPVQEEKVLEVGIPTKE